jgi:hypothetical protein
LHPPEGDHAKQRAPARSHRIAVIAGTHEPSPAIVRAAADLADVVRPDNHDAGAGLRAATPSRPFAAGCDSASAIAAARTRRIMFASIFENWT